ncbi:hypothetical protein DFH11DRAFT_513683 [Phellopilus nigrolimitatus]|nr:hypothetical protein DFH11DRAFT_513683 [Phellopilus nigrolimitatus]
MCAVPALAPPCPQGARRSWAPRGVCPRRTGASSSVVPSAPVQAFVKSARAPTPPLPPPLKNAPLGTSTRLHWVSSLESLRARRALRACSVSTAEAGEGREEGGQGKEDGREGDEQPTPPRDLTGRPGACACLRLAHCHCFCKLFFRIWYCQDSVCSRVISKRLCCSNSAESSLIIIACTDRLHSSLMEPRLQVLSYLSIIFALFRNSTHDLVLHRMCDVDARVRAAPAGIARRVRARVRKFPSF